MFASMYENGADSRTWAKELVWLCRVPDRRWYSRYPADLSPPSQPWRWEGCSGSRAGTTGDQGWKSQRLSSKQKQRNSGQCGRVPAGDFNARHLNRDRIIPWEQGRDNERSGLEILTQSYKQKQRNSGQCGRVPSWISQYFPSNKRQEKTGVSHGIIAGTMEDQGWRSQRQPYEQKQRNSGQCGRVPSWRSQHLPSNKRQENSVGAWQGRWRSRIGDLNASHLNRNRGIQGNVEWAPAGDLNNF